jgi:hypothetical protein
MNWIPYVGIALSNGTSEVPHMQAILIIWPVLFCAFLTGMLFAWVWFVALPRIRRTERNVRSGGRAVFRGTSAPPPRSKSPIVDADQQAIRRNV